MIVASSAGDHFDCFFAGEVGEWGGRERLFVPGDGGGSGIGSFSDLGGILRMMWSEILTNEVRES